MICAHCRQPIEPVDGPGKKYSHRHTESKRILCFGSYESEIATPTEDATMNEPEAEREFSRRVDVQIIKDEPKTFDEWAAQKEERAVDLRSLQAEYDDYTYRFQPYRWRAVAANNEPIAHGESYFNEADAINAVELLMGDDTTMQWAPMYGEDRHYRWLRYGATDRKHQQ